MKSFVSAVQRPILGFFILGVSFFASTAFAEGCVPIISVPVIITTPGTYCLTGDLSAPRFGNSIDVQVDNVILDFKGYDLIGVSGGAGVESRNADNVIIRNGRITGTDIGVNIGSNSVVENMVIHNIRVGVVVAGANTVVRNNVITDVYAKWDSGAAGIIISGSSCTQAVGIQVINNAILNFRNFQNGSGTGYGISAGGCASVINNNTLNGTHVGGTGKHIGIHFPVGSSKNLVIGNSFTGNMGQEISCVSNDYDVVRFKDNTSSNPFGGTYACNSSYGDLGGNL